MCEYSTPKYNSAYTQACLPLVSCKNAMTFKVVFILKLISKCGKTYRKGNKTEREKRMTFVAVSVDFALDLN